MVYRTFYQREHCWFTMGFWLFLLIQTTQKKKKEDICPAFPQTRQYLSLRKRRGYLCPWSLVGQALPPPSQALGTHAAWTQALTFGELAASCYFGMDLWGTKEMFTVSLWLYRTFHCFLWASLWEDWADFFCRHSFHWACFLFEQKHPQKSCYIPKGKAIEAPHTPTPPPWEGLRLIRIIQDLLLLPSHL